MAGGGAAQKRAGAALLAGLLLLAASPATAHHAGSGNFAPHFELSLSSSSVTEGGSVTVSARCVDTCFAGAVSSETERNNAYLTIAITSSSGVSLSPSQPRLTYANALMSNVGVTLGTASGTVTIQTTDNTATSGHRTVTVSATVPSGSGTYFNPGFHHDILPQISSATLTVLDDETSRLSLVIADADDTIAEGESTTVSASVTPAPTSALTVTVNAEAVSPALPGDFALQSGTLSIPAGQTSSTNSLTLGALDDSIDGPDKMVTLTPSPSSGTYGIRAATLTITDDDDAPTVTLAVAPTAITETGGVATVTATLNRASSAATTVTVTMAAVAASGAVAGDFTQSGTVLTVAAGQTTSAGTVTVTANGNAVDAPDKTVRVTGTAGNAQGIMQPSAVLLTLTDDDAAPTVSLSLAPQSVSENGGMATVAAVLSHPSSEPSTVTVTPVTGAYTVGTPAAIVIPAGQELVSAGAVAVLVTAVDNTIHEGSAGRTTTVTATVTHFQGTGAVTGAALTLTDDETRPTAALVLTPAAIAENGGVATVTATLSGRSTQAVTLTVATTAGTGAMAADFAQSGTTLMIAAGATASTGAVTVTANDNNVATGSKQVTVSGTATGGHGITAATGATLTLTDDDTLQATLVLTPTSRSITENGGIATVTATLDRQSSSAVTVTVSATAGTGAVAGDFTLSTTPRLIFAATATTSTGTVTITAVTNETDAPNKSVIVSGVATDSGGLTNDPPDVTLTLTDDDPAPNASLTLTPSTIATETGSSTVQATLDRPSSEPTTVTVNPVAGAYTVGVGTDGFIAIAAGDTSAAGDVASITGVDDNIHQGTAHRTATVTARLTNPQGEGTVAGATLTLTDDETLPTVTLAVTPTAVTEAAQTAQVTATLSGASSQAVTLTVATTAGTGTMAGDFTQTGTTLMIAAGTTASTGTVTVRSTDNNVDAADKAVTVSATAAGGHSIANPPAVTLAITDDEATPTATLVLTPAAITENGEISTVTARLSHPTTAETRLTITNTAVLPAVQADFTRTGSTLTVAAGATTSTGTVTITTMDNSVAQGRKQVTVAASATGGRGVVNPDAVTLIIRDDEFGLDESAVTGQATEGGGTATFTVRLQTQPTAAVTVTVTSRDLSEGTVSPALLVFTSGPSDTWQTHQTVTVTGVDDAVDDGDVTWQVRLDPSSSDTNYNSLDHVDVNVTTADDDDAPTVTLVLTPPAITESGAGSTATVTATLTHPSGAATTVTVSATAVAPARGDDFTLSTPATLIVAAGATVSTGTVTVTANDNKVDAADKAVTVAATVANALGMGMVREATLTLRDDDARGMAFDPAALVVAAGGTATYTVALTSMPTGPVTVTLTPDAAVTVDPARLTFPATSWNTAQPVTLTVAAGTTAPANLVDHAGAGSDYEGTTQALPVTRMSVPVIEPTEPIETTGEAGVHHVLRDNQLVTVTQAAGVPARVTFRPQTSLTRPLTVAIRPLTEDEAADAVGRRFRLGLALDVTVTPSRPGRLCLPVSEEVRRAAGSRPVHLLHNPNPDGDGMWTVLAEGPADSLELCANVGARAFFAVGYKDSGTFAEDVPEEIRRETRFTPEEGEVERHYRLLSEAEAMAEKDKAARNGFRLGGSTVQVALAVTVTPSVPGRLCLGVTNALLDDANGRPLVLLHEGKEVPGSVPELGVDADGETRVVRVCADVEAFSPFAVGYRGVVFSLDEKNFPPFRTGQAVTEEEGRLPAALGGTYSYELLEAETLPAVGLNYDPPAAGAEHGGTITGTPTATMPKRTYTLRATDKSHNNESDELRVTIEVQPGIERRDLALVLAGIGRTLASDAVEILGSRAGPPPARLHVTLGGQVLRLTDPAPSAPAASPTASGTLSPLASAPSPLAGEGGGEGAIPAATPGPSPWQRVTGVAVGVARALGVTLDTTALPSAPPGAGQSEGSTVPSAQTLLARAPADPRRPASPTWRSPLSLQPVSAKDLLARSAFELPLTRTDADGLPTWTVWGRGAASGFAGQPEEGFKMDGTLYSGYLGLDYRQASLLMGLAVAHSTGTVDYERTGGTTAGVDVQLTSLLPYAHWQPRPGLGLWGLLGAGWGEMDLKAVGDPATYTTALTSWLGAVGGRQALTTWQGIDLAAKTDAFLTTLRSEAKTNLPGARGHAERVRLLLEGQTAVALSPVSRVQPRLEVGGRWDSGTAEQGLGLELGGGLAYTQTEWGLSVDMQGRYLLVHEDRAFEDWGASVNVRLDPGLGGEGAYLTVAPVWGQPGSGVEQLWGQAAAVPGDPPAARAAGWRPGNVEIDVGYGLALADGRGLLTPYGGLVLGDPGTARYRLGSRWALSSLLDLNIEGERAEQPGQAVTHSVSVRLGWQW